MLYLTHIPHPPLSQFVELLWLYECGASAHAAERCLPMGSVDLIIDLGADRLRLRDRGDPRNVVEFADSLLCGAHAQYFVIDTTRPRAIMGVHFKPGGAFPFFQLPMDELANLHLPLEVLWRGKEATLRERLLDAATPAEKFHSLERSLLALLARPEARHSGVGFALAQLMRAPCAWKMLDLAETIGLSQRRFIRLFSDEVGLTPKAFCRVRRFQQAIGLIGRARAVDWSTIALACGYYDQAHFIHDFQDFCGLAPTAYLAQRGPHLNHVMVDRVL
jgi:AraC-like DNA-binding protein